MAKMSKKIKAKVKGKPFPSVIYGYWGTDHPVLDSNFSVVRDPAHCVHRIGDKVRVGVYEFVHEVAVEVAVDVKATTEPLPTKGRKTR